MKGKVALVTGGSRGIGRAIAYELALRGAFIALTYKENRENAEEVVKEIESAGSKALASRADLTIVDDITSVFEEVIAHFGRIDFLVNNAGAMINTPIEQVSEDEFDAIFALNVKGLFFCCQQAAKKLQNGGRIINIGSTVTRVMLPNYGTYAASKGAVEQITKVLAKEVGSRQITVNTISPGPTNTELFRKGKSDEQISTLASMSPFNRVGEPKDIAQAVAMICSADASWITGQNIMVNGGFAA